MIMINMIYNNHIMIIQIIRINYPNFFRER